MRANVSFSKAAVALIAADAGRVRCKLSNEGALMFLPTSRKVVSNLPSDEKARKLTRLQSGIATSCVNFEGLSEGVYTLEPGKFGWLTAKRCETLPALNTPRVRITAKKG